MTEAIVHIGFNKCGSTAVQAWLEQNAAALRQAGFAWRRTDPRPDVVCTNPQFLELAFSLAGRVLPPRRFAAIAGYESGNLAAQHAFAARFADGFDRWLARQDAPVVIISNEALGARLDRPALLRPLDRWLGERFTRVRYIGYIRHPVPWAVGAWAQHCKMSGQDTSFESYATRSPRTSFARALPAWEKIVGHARLDLRLYQEGWRTNGGMRADFMAACAIPEMPGLGPFAQRNVTPKPLAWWQSLLPASLRRNGAGRALPAPQPALLRRIAQVNADSMEWIGRTFFADSPAYRAWLGQDYTQSAMKA